MEVRFIGEMSVPEEEAFNNPEAIDRWVLDTLYFNCARPTDIAFKCLNLKWIRINDKNQVEKSS